MWKLLPLPTSRSQSRLRRKLKRRQNRRRRRRNLPRRRHHHPQNLSLIVVVVVVVVVVSLVFSLPPRRSKVASRRLTSVSQALRRETPAGHRASTQPVVSARHSAMVARVSIALIVVSTLLSVTWPSLRFLFVSVASLPLVVVFARVLAPEPMSPRVVSSTVKLKNVPPEVPVGVVHTVDSRLVGNSEARRLCTRRVARIRATSPWSPRLPFSGIRCVIVRFHAGNGRWRLGFWKLFDARKASHSLRQNVSSLSSSSWVPSIALAKTLALTLPLLYRSPQ